MRNLSLLFWLTHNSLWSLGWPGTHRSPSASVFQVLEQQAGMSIHFLLFCFIFEFAHFSWNFLLIYDLFYVYEMFCLCVCSCNTCVSAEIRREGRIPWNWSYAWLWATKCVLGTKIGFSARVALALDSWVISLALTSTVWCQDYRHETLHLVYVVFGVKPRASWIPDKHSTNWATSPTLFCFVWGRSYSITQACLKFAVILLPWSTWFWD